MVGAGRAAAFTDVNAGLAAAAGRAAAGCALPPPRSDFAAARLLGPPHRPPPALAAPAVPCPGGVATAESSDWAAGSISTSPSRSETCRQAEEV